MLFSYTGEFASQVFRSNVNYENWHTRIVRGHASTGVVRWEHGIEIFVNAVVIKDVEEFLESLVDEDKGDQTGKRLFCEPCNVAHLQRNEHVSSLNFIEPATNSTTNFIGDNRSTEQGITVSNFAHG